MAGRASIGLKRIPRDTPTTVAAATRSMRKQFAIAEQNLKAVIDAIERETPGALLAAMEPIFKASQELVPKDTERLMQSGFLTQGTFRGNPAVNIGYGAGRSGKASQYAIFVHEDLNAAHDAGTQAKFLEQPYKEQMNQIPQRVKHILKSGLKL